MQKLSGLKSTKKFNKSYELNQKACSNLGLVCGIESNVNNGFNQFNSIYYSQNYDVFLLMPIIKTKKTTSLWSGFLVFQNSFRNNGFF